MYCTKVQTYVLRIQWNLTFTAIFHKQNKLGVSRFAKVMLQCTYFSVFITYTFQSYNILVLITVLRNVTQSARHLRVDLILIFTFLIAFLEMNVSIRVFHKCKKFTILALLPTLNSHIFAVSFFTCTI